MQLSVLRSHIAAALVVLVSAASVAAAPMTPQPSKAVSAKVKPTTQLEQITVTATRTGATALQSTPIAITALSGRQLTTRGINNLNDLTTLSPNIELTDLAGQSSLFIRGIGTSNGGYVGSDPSSTLQIDGVYISRALAYDTDFLDIDRVEILRGPQGTLYGRNAVGGTINIITRTPTDTPQGEVRLSGGTFGEFGAQGYVSGPIGDNGVLGSLAYGHQQHDPYLKNISTGNAVQDDNTDATRGQLVIPFAIDGRVTLRADFSHRDWAVAVFPKLLKPDGVPLDDAIVGDFTRVDLNRDSHARETDAGASVQIDYPINSIFSLKSLTAFRADRSYVDDDPDASSLDILRTVSSPSAEEQLSEEANITAADSSFRTNTPRRPEGLGCVDVGIETRADGC